MGREAISERYLFIAVFIDFKTKKIIISQKEAESNEINENMGKFDSFSILFLLRMKNSVLFLYI